MSTTLARITFLLFFKTFFFLSSGNSVKSFFLSSILLPLFLLLFSFPSLLFVFFENLQKAMSIASLPRVLLGQVRRVLQFMHTIGLVGIEVLVVVALIPDLLAEGYIQADDLFAILVNLSFQVNVVLFLNFLEFFQAFISFLAFLLLLFTELILVLLLFTVADLI